MLHGAVPALGPARGGQRRAEAEDVLHDTWIIAIDKVHQYRGQPPACGWIGTIVRHEAQHAAKRRRRALPADDRRDAGDAGPDRPADDASPEDAAHQRQMVRLLLEVVDSLPPIYREVVRLRDIEERSEHEAAARLGLSDSGAASRLLRAHRLVRDRLRRRLRHPRP